MIAAMTANIVTTIADPYPISCLFAIIAQQINNPTSIAIINQMRPLGMIINSTTITIAQSKAVTKTDPNSRLSESTKPKPILRNIVINKSRKINKRTASITPAVPAVHICSNIFNHYFYIIF